MLPLKNDLARGHGLNDYSLFEVGIADIGGFAYDRPLSSKRLTETNAIKLR